MRNFLDTNILIYADACDELKKQEQAIEIIRENIINKSGVISTQVLKEFANVALRKLGLSPEIVKQRIEFFLNFEIIEISPEIIMQAIDLSSNRKVSFYDALIIETAIISSCETILSEDLQSGAIFNAVRVVNPFE